MVKKIKNYMFMKIGKISNLPLRLHIEISNLCNLRCKYCVLHNNLSDKSIMTMETFMKLKPYFKYLRSVSLSGLAEPLLNKNIVEFINIIKKEAPLCVVSIITNAQLLNEEIARELVDAGLDKLNFSLDGVDNTTVDSIRLNGNLDTIVTNVKKLKEIKKQRESASPHLSAAMVLYKSNYKQIAQTVELAASLGVESFSLNYLEPYSDDMLDEIVWMDDDLLKDVSLHIEEGKKVAESYGVGYQHAEAKPQDESCRVVLTPLIMANGDIVPCHVFAYPRTHFFAVENDHFVRQEKQISEIKFGNINKRKLSQIWRDKKYKSFREDVLNNKFPKACHSCLIKHGCICGG